MWVPEHSEIVGNEMANKLSRKGSSYPFIGPEPEVGLSVRSRNSIIVDVRYWLIFPASGTIGTTVGSQNY